MRRGNRKKSPSLADENQFSFLLCMLSENLSHARHVENERMMFNSIFAALVSVALGTLSKVDSFFINLVMLLLLLSLSIVAYNLTSRWNKVFREHMEKAKLAYNKLNSLPTSSSFTNRNAFYCFERFDPESHAGYLHTSTYFKVFDGLVLASIVATIGFRILMYFKIIIV